MGLFVLISAPSGAGKDTVIDQLIERLPLAGRLVTTTSRPPREGEVDGRDYFFVSEKQFLEKLKADAFVEYNFYAGNYYGTEQKVLDEALEKFAVVFSRAEVNGKKALDNKNIKHLAVFLLPESYESLEQRIRARGDASENQIKWRMQAAMREVMESKIYDLRIVNEDGKLEQTIDKLYRFIFKELTVYPQTQLTTVNKTDII